MNNALCLSAAPALRCSNGLLFSQALGLFIPPAVEVLCISILVFTQWSKGRKHWFLILDSWFFIALCLADFLVQIRSNLLPSLAVFKIYDRILAAASMAPILFHCLFLFLLTKSDMLPILPLRFRRSFQVILFLCLPLIIIPAEIASFMGLAYIERPSPAVPRFWINFINSDSKMTWTLLNAISLAVYTAFQAITFFLTGFRLARHFMTEREYAANSRTKDASMSIKGLGWIAAAIKIGAIESLLGFIPVAFEMVLARRLMRLLGRVILVVGVMKGMDQLDGLTFFRANSIDSIEGLPPRRIPVMTEVRGRIGNPRLSTFGQLSPEATSFHQALAASRSRELVLSEEDERAMRERSNIKATSQTSLAAFVTQHAASELPPTRPRPTKKRPPVDPNARVTVYYDGLAAPILEMRFSALDFPGPDALLQDLREASVSGSPVTNRASLMRRAMSTRAHAIGNPFDDLENAPGPIRRAHTLAGTGRFKQHLSAQTDMTSASATLADMRAFASQFPQPPDAEASGYDLEMGRGYQSQSFSAGSNPDRAFDTDPQYVPLPKSASTYGPRSRAGSVTTIHTVASSVGPSRHSSVRRKPPPLPSPQLLQEALSRENTLPSMPAPIATRSYAEEQAIMARTLLRRQFTNRDSESTFATAEPPSAAPGFGRARVTSSYAPSFVQSPELYETTSMMTPSETSLERRSTKKELMGYSAISPQVPASTLPHDFDPQSQWDQYHNPTSRPQTPAGEDQTRRKRRTLHKEPPMDWIDKHSKSSKSDTNSEAGGSTRSELNAAWQNATASARTAKFPSGLTQAGGDDHSIGKVKQVNTVNVRTTPRPHAANLSIGSFTPDHVGHVDAGPFDDAYGPGRYAPAGAWASEAPWGGAGAPSRPTWRG